MTCAFARSTGDPPMVCFRRVALTALALNLCIAGCYQYKQNGEGEAAEGQREATIPTFHRDVSKIFYEHCASCHHTAGSAPFPLMDYRDIAKRADQIVDVIESGYMPPWLPEGGSFEFKNAPSFSGDNLATIKTWIRHEMPHGNEAGRVPAPVYSEDWELGEPDLIVEMERPYVLAPDGPDVYRHFVLPLPIDRERYVRAFEFRSDSPQVVHHAFVLTDSTGESRRLDSEDSAEGYDGMDTLGGARSPDGHLIGWLPGRGAITSPEQMPWTLRPRTDLVLQVHMQPSGRTEQVTAQVGFYFTKRPPTKFPVQLSLFSATIDIPAHDDNYLVRDAFTLPTDVFALAITAHAHYLGRRLEALAVFPDGTERHLLKIPEWDFNWQGVYDYKTPVHLPRGTRLEMRFQYDNSSENPRNPHHPPQRVRYGLNTTDEMAEIGLQVLTRDPADRPLLMERFRSRVSERILEHSEFLLREKPDDIDAMLRKSQALIVLGRKQESLTALKQAVKRFPDNARLHKVLGEVLRLYFDAPNRAIASLERALRLDPSLVSARSQLGRIYFGLKQFQVAESYFAAIPTDSPDYPTALSHLGFIAGTRGQLISATKYFEQAYSLNTSNQDARRNYIVALTKLGASYADKGQYRMALPHFETCVRLDPSNEDLARNLQRTRQLLEASSSH